MCQKFIPEKKIKFAKVYIFAEAERGSFKYSNFETSCIKDAYLEMLRQMYLRCLSIFLNVD